MTNEQFEREYYPRYKSVIEAIARKAASDDRDLWDDLVQAGTIGLLNVDLAKATTNLDAYIRNTIRNKIIDYVRWTRYRTFDRLDAYLRNNHDVVKDPITGEATFIHGDNELHTFHRAGTEDADPEPSTDGVPAYVTKRQRLAAIHEYEREGED